MSNFKIISPSTGKLLTELPFANSKQIEESLASARQAQVNWANLSLQQRKEFVEKWLDKLKQDEENAAQEITEQMGRPISQAPGELAGMHQRAQYLLQISGEALATIQIDETLSGSPPPFEVERYIEKSPLGIVLIIAPWNFPYLTVINSLVPALLAGNTVILKHAPSTALCGDRLAKVAIDILPHGVLQHVMMQPQDIQAIMETGKVDAVNFTGSAEIGKTIHSQASTHMIKTNLELGGKDAAYVAQDANIKFSAKQLVDGAFFNAGQSCCSIERIYVHQAVYTEFMKAFKEQTAQLVLGEPMEIRTSLGPVANELIYQRANKQIKQAKKQGAKITCLHEKPNTDGFYIPPTIITEVTPDMTVMREESFAPIVCIMSVENNQEAIKQINHSDYGLTASIWSSDSEHAKEMMSQLQVGTAFLNQCDYLDPALAWTGVKQSGLGVSLSILGFDAFTQPKSYYLRKQT